MASIRLGKQEYVYSDQELNRALKAARLSPDAKRAVLQSAARFDFADGVRGKLGTRDLAYGANDVAVAVDSIKEQFRRASVKGTSLSFGKFHDLEDGFEVMLNKTTRAKVYVTGADATRIRATVVTKEVPDRGFAAFFANFDILRR